MTPTQMTQRVLVFALQVILLGVGLFPYEYVEYAGGLLGRSLRIVGQCLADSSVSPAMLVFLGSITLSCLFNRSEKLNFSTTVWLLLAVCLAILRFTLDEPTDALHGFVPLLASLTVGLAGSRLMRMLGPQREFVMARILVGGLLILPFVQSNYPTTFRYHDAIRASGPYLNPNTFGMLMGVGLILTVGILLAAWTGRPPHKALLLIVATSVAFFTWWMALAFSRGAWFSTIAGLGWLVWLCRRQWSSFRRLAALVLVAIVIGAGSAIAVSSFEHGENVVLRRIESVLNRDDFSWQNRLVAWQGALQMIAEHPVLGVGWTSVRSCYENLFRPLTTPEGGAVETNDTLKLAAAAGLGFVAAWFTYIYALLMTSTRQPVVDPAIPSLSETRSNIARASFSAAAFALVFGSCFNSMWFEFSTASIFWWLLHAGADNPDGVKARPAIAQTSFSSYSPV